MNALTRTVSAVAVVDLANELLDRGCLKQDDLESIGEDFRRSFRDWQQGQAIEERRLPEQQLLDLWLHAETLGCDKTLGLAIGFKVNLNARGILATWLSQCHNLSEAFRIFSDHIALLNPSETWHKIEQRDRVGLAVTFTDERYPDLAIDRSLAAMLAWARELCGAEICPLALDLTRKNCEASMAQQFSTEVRTGQCSNCLWYSREDFERAIEGANPYLESLVKHQALRLHDRLSVGDSMTFQVQELLRRDLPRYCQIVETCEALHLSRSSLYRKLKAEGTSFTLLLKAARRKLHRELEDVGLSHEQLAERLGFENVSSYYRFRKSGL